jgi:Kyakuja-Dileera-Zisupton transposase
MNIDYAICQALSHQTDGLKSCLLIYDVVCQWWKNFHHRVEQSTTLYTPRNISIIPAIGKFHLGGHIPECFSIFSLNFIQGAGQQDGEILETLWSSLNKVSGSIRAMTKAHRQEVLDAHMRDSNWKKLVGMGE